MPMNLYEQAKQAVAEKHGCDTWKDMLTIADSVGADLDVFYQEVGEWMANEAVKADRAEISRRVYVNDKAKIAISMIPLPFPQQPEQR